MRILYLSQYFVPEMCAPAARVHECAREWVRQGHQVTVVTGMPHHPTGIVAPGYRGRAYVREARDGIDVCRCYVYATPNRGVLKRAWSYFTFLVSSVVLGFFCTRKPDIVVATSPQLFAGFAGWALAGLKRAPFVFEVRDLWPESIEAVGAVRSKAALAPLYALAALLYRRARHIVVVSESSREALLARRLPASKISVITNGVDRELFGPVEPFNAVRERHGFNGAFVVLYIGTIGMAHGLEVMLKAAEAFRRDPAVKFLVVGEGARKEALRQQAKALPNVVFADACPREKVREYIAACDVALVHLIRSELFKTVLPSKMFEIMACERPVLLGVDGEARRVIERARAGIFFAPEDAESLAREITRLRGDPGLCRELGANGRRHVDENYSRESLARRYSALLGTLAARKTARHAQEETAERLAVS